jgi:hypothetical protein
MSKYLSDGKDQLLSTSNTSPSMFFIDVVKVASTLVFLVFTFLWSLLDPMRVEVYPPHVPSDRYSIRVDSMACGKVFGLLIVYFELDNNRGRIHYSGGLRL